MSLKASRAPLFTLHMTRVFSIQRSDVLGCRLPVAICVMMKVTQDPFHSLETCPARYAQAQADRKDLKGWTMWTITNRFIQKTKKGD